MGNNPSGINQLGSDRVPYGDAKKMKELAGQAPMSGAPIAASAINAPRRAQHGGKVQQAPQQEQMPQSPVPQTPVTYQAYIAQTWGQIAQIPGASPLVQSLAQQASLGG